MKPVRHVEVEIHVDPLVGPQTRLTEATVFVRCPGRDRNQATRILAAMAPEIFDSVRLYFQTPPEQRLRERWPLTHPVRIHPVLPDLELAEVIEGVCQNISFGGIRILVPRRPPTEQMFLHLYAAECTRDYAILRGAPGWSRRARGSRLGRSLPAAEHEEGPGSCQASPCWYNTCNRPRSSIG